MDAHRARLQKRLADVTPLSGNLRQHKTEQHKAAFAGNKGAYIPHVYHVFNDVIFQQEVASLRRKLESLYYKNISLSTSDTDEHLLLEDKKLVKDLADKYCITLSDLGIYADGYFEAGYEFGRRISEYGGLEPNILSDTHRLCYVIGPKTTLEQIIADWPYVKGWRAELIANAKENTKNKSPDDPILIYAIFKARANGLKFSKVFTLYQSGELVGYENEPTNQFSSADSLARYYRKYMPEPQKNEIVNPHEEAYKQQHS